MWSDNSQRKLKYEMCSPTGHFTVITPYTACIPLFLGEKYAYVRCGCDYEMKFDKLTSDVCDHSRRPSWKNMWKCSCGVDVLQRQVGLSHLLPMLTVIKGQLNDLLANNLSICGHLQVQISSCEDEHRSERESSFLTAHQLIRGHSVP